MVGFDAGDHVKFGFAMASSATMLAWSGVEYRNAFQQSGQLPHLLNNLRVATDYFMKCHTAPNELYGQVGDAGADHSFWGPAEIMQMARPAFKIDMAHPGADLAAQTASALAAASIVFRPTDPAYANTLLTHARQLFTFGAEHSWHLLTLMQSLPPRVSTTVALATHRMRSQKQPSGCFAPRMKRLSSTQHDSFIRPCGKENGTQTPCFTWAQSWNDKHFGVYVMMAKLTGEQQFKTDAQRWLDFWSIGAGRRTPVG